VKFLPFLLLIAISTYFYYTSNRQENNQSTDIIFTPRIGDIYFIDYRLIAQNLRPADKLRIAKVVDVTGDIITLLYGSYSYPNHYSMVNSIKYGQVSFPNYFKTKRHNFSHGEIKTMLDTGAIYLAKRPVRGELYGRSINPTKQHHATNKYIYGLKENITGEAFLQNKFSETGLQQAFEHFKLSAELGYDLGQVNLAQMYINGQHVEPNLTTALYWLKQASLQSYKPAILKFAIVCEQIPECNINNFYRELSQSGVNIKVRELSFTLD
jgi:TPR repeat protein